MTYRQNLFRGDSDGPAEFLGTADQIGAEFVRDAIWSGDRSGWPCAGGLSYLERDAPRGEHLRAKV